MRKPVALSNSLLSGKAVRIDLKKDDTRERKSEARQLVKKYFFRLEIQIPKLFKSFAKLL